MRITGGKFRNRSVQISRKSGVRPTSSKMREAIFSMLGQDLDGWSFLDAFGGSGVMGMEAYSRGATSIVSELDPQVFRNIKSSTNDLGMIIKVLRCDAENSIASRNWDIIFLDPPYSTQAEHYVQLAFSYAQHFVIVETHVTSDTIEAPMEWSLWKNKSYGTSKLVIYRRGV